MTTPEPSAVGGGKPPGQPRRMLAAVLRMDLKDSEEAVVRDEDAFLRHMGLLRDEVSDKSTYPSIVGKDGGEGDSIRIAFTDVRDALACAILLCHRAQQPIPAAGGTTFILKPRIVLHFGEFTEGREGRIEGRGQVLVTRLDHAVPPGEILATEDFVDISRHLGVGQHYSFEYVGECDLTKNSGKYPCYAVRIVDENFSARTSRRPLDLHELAIELFRNGDQESQSDAVEALGAIETEAASRELMNIALNHDIARRVRHAALLKLQERRDDLDIGLITAEFSEANSDIETRALLLLALGATGREEIFGTLREVCSNGTSSSRLREAAFLAMRTLRSSLIKETVNSGLEAPEDEVRIAACVAAASGGMSSGAQTKLNEIASDPSLPLDLRGIACEALAAQKLTDNLIEMLSPFVLDRDFPLALRRYAIGGLERFNNNSAATRAIEEVARRQGDALRGDAIIALATMKAPRLNARQRAYPPASHVAEVIQLRTRPQPG